MPETNLLLLALEGQAILLLIQTAMDLVRRGVVGPYKNRLVDPAKVSKPC